MSKRAEELWELISEHVDLDQNGYEETIFGLIDAELRKERERCAERAIAWNRGPDPRGDMAMWAKEDAKLRAAVVSEDTP